MFYMEQVQRQIICRKIRQLRKKAGYTQQEIAALLNISQNTYSDIETGKRKIDIERIYSIAKVYGVTVDSLLPPPPG
jgi:XRE family transcriptional regulator, regulator of sulfur utilization